MNEQLMQIIKSHNAIVKTADGLDIPVPEGEMFKVMELWHKLACEGADITHMAREAGIGAKCDMQTGKIIIVKGAEIE